MLSLDKCSKILQEDLQSTEFKILNYEEKSLSEKEVNGNSSGNFRIQIKVKVNDETLLKQYFVKKLHSRYEIQNYLTKIQGAYDKEKFAYDFLQQLSKLEPRYSIKYIPKCFLTLNNDKFILEDLRKEGFIANKLGTYWFDIPHLKQALELAAKFHSGTIIFEHKKFLESGAKYKITDDYAQYFKDPLYRKEEPDYLGNKLQVQNIETTIALIDKCVIYSSQEKEELKNKVLKHADCFFTLLKASDRFCNVMNHGDLWCNNILFKYNNDEITDIKLVDFQAIRYTPPANDFLNLVWSAGNTDFVNSIQKDMQVHYYNSLKDCLQKCDVDINNYLTYEEFEESLLFYRPLAILQKAGYSAMYSVVVDTSIMKSSEKFADFMYENRSCYCIESYDQSDMFRGIIHDGFKNLKLL